MPSASKSGSSRYARGRRPMLAWHCPGNGCHARTYLVCCALKLLFSSLDKNRAHNKHLPEPKKSKPQKKSCQLRYLSTRGLSVNQSEMGGNEVQYHDAAGDTTATQDDKIREHDVEATDSSLPVSSKRQSFSELFTIVSALPTKTTPPYDGHGSEPPFGVGPS